MMLQHGDTSSMALTLSVRPICADARAYRKPTGYPVIRSTDSLARGSLLVDRVLANVKFASS
jgi:hypothetical protein